MLTLFPLDPHLPPGFRYEENFLTEEAEGHLLEHIRTLRLKTFVFNGYEAKRKVASFGWDWSFETRTLKKGAPIPPFFEPLLRRLATHLHIEHAAIVELLVTEYAEGTVINWHRDAPPFHTIIGLSLLSDCTFKFRPYGQEKGIRRESLSWPVRRRSLYVMEGAARSEWEHSIAPVGSLRYSVTVRTLK